MPPKQPNSTKLSKQELKAQKREQKEKKKEDAKKLAEERKRLAEEEAKRLEEEARLAWEAEQARLQAERERILREKETLSSFFDWRSSTLANSEATKASQDDWTRFLEPGNTPHATNEGDMNNYFNVLETSWDENYDAALVTVKNIYKVILNTEELYMLEVQKGNKLNFVERYDIYMKKLESFMQKRVDLTTAYLLKRSYEVYKQTNETTVFAMAGDWKIYLWINHVKNPRLRVLNEPTLGITITIPKAFTFANAAIRVYHQMLNPLLKSSNIYTVVGGVFVLDILSIPPASRSAKGWTFEHVTMMTSSVVRLGYPFVGDSSGAPALIGLEFSLPATLIVAECLPEVGWWDEEEECWKKDGIIDVEYEKSSRILKFQTIRARPHAIIQSRVKYYPYHSWILTPISESKALFVLESHGHSIKIEVGSGWCKLIETPFGECKHIIGQELDPIILLKKLSRCGLHLMPVDDDGQFVQACIKETKVESYICDDIALAIPACAIASSKWNPEAGQDSCVVRILEIPDSHFPPTFEKSKDVRMILYKAKGNGILNMLERKSKEYKEELLGEFHASIMITLRESLARESLDKMEKGDPGFTECFKLLALGLRLFSFTSIETSVQPADVPTQDAVPENGENKEQKEAPAIEERPPEGDLATAAPESKSQVNSPQKVGETEKQPS